MKNFNRKDVRQTSKLGGNAKMLRFTSTANLDTSEKDTNGSNILVLFHLTTGKI